MSAGVPTTAYTVVCGLDRVPREGGVCALVEGRAVAVFRTWDDEVFALDNYDPFSRASVLARGIVGTRGEVPFVASPMHKQAFDLRTGQCLDDAAVRVPTYDVAVRDGTVLVGPARR
ncbi:MULTISPECIES: nitrite reductase small subunit NirD [unclassified Nocardioides]|uniref:nitrite reductase small subunit NirD n=1 Tax=unclassified Nocardioides TaxID=2615069 RepID=UPI0026650BEB|nr:nitrite reductase small subunit NirD [Nocardioides sp. Arc9.136]WKN48828.1 nitrite reductase small subunit NirD [Nocardioides sp. Arc9.136]